MISPKNTTQSVARQTNIADQAPTASVATDAGAEAGPSSASPQTPPRTGGRAFRNSSRDSFDAIGPDGAHGLGPARIVKISPPTPGGRHSPSPNSQTRRSPALGLPSQLSDDVGSSARRRMQDLQRQYFPRPNPRILSQYFSEPHLTTKPAASAQESSGLLESPIITEQAATSARGLFQPSNTTQPHSP